MRRTGVQILRLRSDARLRVQGKQRWRSILTPYAAGPPPVGFSLETSSSGGAPQRPGLVLGLDRGGACRGVAFRVAAARVGRSLESLWEREMRRGVYHPRLLRARLPSRTARVLAFVANPRHPGYAGTLPTERTAELIANCHGDRGPNVEYLARTLKHLAQLGVRDHHLLRVMAAVEKIWGQSRFSGAAKR